MDMTKIEHERRFVLSRLPDPAEASTVTHITQVYMRDGSRLRRSVSMTGTGPQAPKYERIVKRSVGTASATETDVDGANEAEFNRALDEGLPSVSKVRRTYPHGGLVWEVDEFEHPFRLVIAEVELERPDAPLATHPTISRMVVAEVTGTGAASNAALARSLTE